MRAGSPATRCHQFGAIAAWEAVYNLRLRVSEASACAGVLPAQSRAQPPDGMTPIPGRMERHGPNTMYSSCHTPRSYRSCADPVTHSSLPFGRDYGPSPSQPSDMGRKSYLYGPKVL